MKRLSHDWRPVVVGVVAMVFVSIGYVASEPEIQTADYSAGVSGD